MKNKADSHFYHINQIHEERCKEHLDCIRVCPTKAIRVFNGKVEIIPELCIDCGRCVKTCTENVFVPLSDDLMDFDKYKYLVAIPSPVLYTQFGSDVNPGIIHQALKNIGINEVVDLSDTCNKMTYAMYHHIKNNVSEQPVIITICPTIIRLIQVSYPHLVPLLSPFSVPREIVAKTIKQTYPEKLGLNIDEIAIVYIAPCPAKIISIKQPAERVDSWIDSSIPIEDIYNLISAEIIKIRENEEEEYLENFQFCRGWRASDYISWELGLERSLSVTGLDQVINVLNDIENSKLRNIDVIGALACRDECLGGSFCVENHYTARRTSITLEKKYGISESEIDKQTALKNYEKKHYFLENPILPRSTQSTADIATGIKRLRQKDRILMKLPKKDCGLCGSPTCDTFAEDIAYGRANITDCAFFSDNFKNK